MSTIIIAAAVLGGLGLVFGALLTVASKAFYVEVDPRVEKVRECLAGANCGACGFAGCDAFAKAVVDGKASADGCAPGGASAAKAIADIMGVKVDETKERMVARVLCQGDDAMAKERYIYDGYKSCLVASGMAGGPKLCRFSCIGLGDCMDVCAFGAISLKNNLAVIDEDKCASCGQCVDICPRNAISLMPQSKKVIVRCRNSDVAREARNVCMTACIACGRCKKECKYDAIIIEGGYARIDTTKCTRCGECAKVCPCKCITID
ncbi:MAG: RnfABCDGE type electron transport complex subunit B [Clostridia bacterium]|nr:RnfABCDGE type electron transport complex subunit B [Clostridia bacterium]